MTAQTSAVPMLSSTEQRIAARQLTLAMLALGLLALGLAWRGWSPEQSGVSQLLLGFASLLVAVPVMRSAWYSLRYPSLHGITDQLIALAMLGAWATGDLLTAALLPIIMIFGHVLEERSVIGSQEAIHALGQLTRSQGRKVQADGSIIDVDNATLQPGDVVEVRAGDRVPADGRVLSGQASLDTAPITGESVPLEAVVGTEVFGGAINLDGLLRLEVTRTGEESTLGKVIALMQNAERSKPPITRLLERYAGSYLVLVLLLAAVTWFVTNDAQAMLAVLVAACPCALVLSAPATAIAGIAVAARHGILIRSSAFLEELADLTSLVVDKTGTLTYGVLRLQSIEHAQDAPSSLLLPLAASLGSASSHPVSRALAGLVEQEDCLALTDIHERQGLGVVAMTAWGEAALGRPELFAQMGIQTSAVPEHDGPIAGLALDGQFLAWLLLADSVKPEARMAMAELRELGLGRQLLLTGDRQSGGHDPGPGCRHRRPASPGPTGRQTQASHGRNRPWIPPHGGGRWHQRFPGAQGRGGRRCNGRRRRRYRPGIGRHRADRQRPAPSRHLRAIEPPVPTHVAGQRDHWPGLDAGYRRLCRLRLARRGGGDDCCAAAQSQYPASVR